MKQTKVPNSRRRVLKASLGMAAMSLGTGTVPRACGFEAANSRPRIGVVGCGVRWDKRVFVSDGRYGVGKQFPKFGDIVTVCDVDAQRLDRARGIVKGWLGKVPAGTGDYRRGRLICDVCKKTGAVFQVGTQQRSGSQFVKAIALIREGRLGELRSVQCAIGGSPTSPEIPIAPPPKHFDWDRWLGPAPVTDYRFQAGASNIIGSWSRAHYEFRWWYEYSGGKLTDWGAHHIDIATWGIDDMPSRRDSGQSRSQDTLGPKK